MFISLRLEAETCLEWKQTLDQDTSWGGSIGYKRVLSGVNLKKNTGHNWTLQGKFRGEKSSHNHSEVYSLMAKHAF